MKKILFILFVAQFILAPYIIKGYGANLVEDNYEYSGVDQGRETVEKDILGNIIIRDDNGNRKTIEKDILGISSFVMIKAIERLLKRIFWGTSLSVMIEAIERLSKRIF